MLLNVVMVKEIDFCGLFCFGFEFVIVVELILNGSVDVLLLVIVEWLLFIVFDVLWLVFDCL